MALRVQGCPGFYIPSLNHPNYFMYHCKGPTSGKDYNGHTLVPKTKLCIHENCQPFAEMDYFLMKAYLNKEITREDWINSRKGANNFQFGIDDGRKEWCNSNTIIERDIARAIPGGDRPYLPLILPPTRPCTHEGDSCLWASSAMHSLYFLTLNGVFSTQLFNRIVFQGWGKRLDDEMDSNR